MARLTLSVISLPEETVDLHLEPLHLARQLLGSAGSQPAMIPELGVETPDGRVYDPDEVEAIEPRLAEAIAALDVAFPAERYFNERQELRAALEIFRTARAHRSGVELAA